MNNPRTTVIKGDPVIKEGVAGAAITPGHLIEFDGSGQLQPHATAGGVARKAFAHELAAAGQSIDTAYVVGGTVKYGVHRSGDEVYAFLDAGEEVSQGDPLQSAGNGALEALESPGEESAGGSLVAFAAEDLDNSGGASPVRLRAEVA